MTTKPKPRTSLKFDKLPTWQKLLILVLAVPSTVVAGVHLYQASNAMWGVYIVAGLAIAAMLLHASRTDTDADIDRSLKLAEDLDKGKNNGST